MKTIAEYNDLNIPTWALSYLVNHDNEGLTSKEVAEINAWAMSFEPYPKAGFLLSTEQDEYFTWHPEFGAAATCVKGTVKIVK